MPTLKRLNMLETKLRERAAEVNGDYVQYFRDRADTIAGYIETIENGWPFDNQYIEDLTDDFEKTV